MRVISIVSDTFLAGLLNRSYIMKSYDPIQTNSTASFTGVVQSSQMTTGVPDNNPHI
jgi:hypothetical protein